MAILLGEKLTKEIQIQIEKLAEEMLKNIKRRYLNFSFSNESSKAFINSFPYLFSLKGLIQLGLLSNSNLPLFCKGLLSFTMKKGTEDALIHILKALRIDGFYYIDLEKMQLTFSYKLNQFSDFSKNRIEEVKKTHLYLLREYVPIGISILILPYKLLDFVKIFLGVSITINVKTKIGVSIV